MPSIDADTPLPSTEGITETSSSPASPNRHRTPSVSLTPPGRTRGESYGLTSAINNIRLSDANGYASLSPEPRRSRNGTPRRRRSSTGAVQQHDVADEELPDDAFHSPEFQGAFRDAKQLMSNIQSVLGSSIVHEGSGSTMRKLHEEAVNLAAFEYPATRTVGFVGDSGVGKSSLLNSLLDTKGLARTSNNGEACTCVVTEYHYHNRDTLDIRVNLFSIEELQDQLGRLLQVYRTFELHQDEITDDAERQDMEANAKVAKDTFRAMFRGRLTDEASLIRENYDDVLDRLISWAADARPSPQRTCHTGLSPQACSDTLMELSSEPASRDSPATWPYIRSINRGLILVDLPGLRDLNSARRIITERYLLECNEIFAICNIGRAATDEGVHQVFDLADRARLSNVGIVCTRSDDIDPEESIRDWPGRRARHIEQLLEHIETATKEIEELQADIEDYGASDLSEQERQELAECCEDQRQARTRKQNYDFELKEYLITNRNRIITESLNNTYAGRVTPSRVFCVSNTIYWQNRTAKKSEAKRYLDLSGVLQVRKHCISIVANSQRRIATRYMKDQIPALLADIELWVQSGARTASEERREALCQTLDSVERRLRKDFASRAFSRLARGYNEDFAEYVYNIGSRNWNEEAMDEMVTDLGGPWEEMCGALQERQSSMLENADEFADMAIEKLEEHDSVDSLTQALENRQSIFLAAIEKVNDEFENNLRCNAELGRGSDARRKAIIRGALSDEDLFAKLMRSLKDSFQANSEATQAKIQEATMEYLRVIEGRFDLVRSENVARESEQDPDFRLRVDQVARAGRETMQRVHQHPKMSARTMLRQGLRPLRPHVSFRRYISTRDMTATDLKKLKVDQSRLMETLHDTCKWGAGLKWGDNPTDTGMSRLALSDSDKTVRDWFVETTKSLGCKVTIDSIGNIFAIRPGRKDGPPTVAGSHLDTQPTGGRYDGILGIQAGIEMLKILRDHDVETEYPVGVVNWTNEEGARFPISMMASGVWAEAISEERAHNLKEVSGNATVKSELERIGYLGDTPASYKAMPIGAHFELHIEQGPILERAGKNIGVVQGVQAYKWFTIDITGRDAHTGSTPFSDRADALLLAARLITHSHRLATKHKALASTGILNLTPGSTNTIPGHVSFTLDIRSPSDETVEKLEEELRRDFDLLAQGTDVDGLLAGSTPALPLSLKWRTDTISTATKFHPDCIQAVRESAESILGKDAAVDISSGAGHDSVYTNKHCPTTMIFIPCKGGVSHNPEEYSSPEECTIGAEVLCQAVVRYDQKRV
ncbi:hypothetical protein LZL87_002870 [Fusarium oxysporum]|nr:hypothetical protein LZL87_002870 [Fusarium oxysporum]